MAQARKPSRKTTAKKKNPAKKPTTRASAKAKASASSKASAKTNKTKAASSKQIANRKIYIWGSVVTAVLLIIVFSGVWYAKIYNSPTNMFWGMVNDSLATPGITRQVVQNTGSNNSDELTQFSFGEPTTANINKTVFDSGSGGKTQTEGIGNGSSDFQRYLSITQANTATKQVDFSSIYGVWIKLNDNGDVGKPAVASPTILLQSLLGPVMLGNLQPTDRHAVISSLKSGRAYTIDLANVSKKTIDGRQVYVFPVKIGLHDYAAALNIYGKATGLPGASGINPENYQSSDELDVDIAVDKSSHQLVQVKYKTADVSETYTSHGIYAPVSEPQNWVPVKPFQQKIQQLTGQSAS